MDDSPRLPRSRCVSSAQVCTCLLIKHTTWQCFFLLPRGLFLHLTQTAPAISAMRQCTNNALSPASPRCNHSSISSSHPTDRTLAHNATLRHHHNPSHSQLLITPFVLALASVRDSKLTWFRRRLLNTPEQLDRLHWYILPPLSLVNARRAAC